MTNAAPLPLFIRPPVSRPVDPEWKCHQSGDCCSLPAEVVMTRPERVEMLRHMPEDSRITTEWRDVEGEMVGGLSKFVAMKAHPCPMFIFNSCVVYAHRPFNCRRFACMRPDPKTEPLELGGNGNGCLNAMDRYETSRVARRLMERIQRKAQGWAHRFGWMEPPDGQRPEQ